MMKLFLRVFLLANLIWLLGCEIASTAGALDGTLPVTQTVTLIPSTTQHPSLTPTLTKTITATLQPSATDAPTITATITKTPEPLSFFSTKAIRPGVLPQNYIEDACTYLRQRWATEGARPGTVVVPIMFHGIRQDGRPILDNVTIYQAQFTAFIQYAEDLGFETITIAQLVGFLTQNAAIPERSLLMIVDDRRPGTIETSFLPALEPRNWTVTLGWPIGETDEALWDWMERMNATGLLDIQSHGLLHRYVNDQMTEAEIREELTGPIAIHEQHFGYRPTAFIWPGGNFNQLSVNLAREAGYQVAFTAYARGPLMFNWIPLGAEEQMVNDPLMVLPRFWSTALGVNLDVAVKISEQAKEDAAEKFSAEAQYYRIYCGGELPVQP